MITDTAAAKADDGGAGMPSCDYEPKGPELPDSQILTFPPSSADPIDRNDRMKMRETTIVARSVCRGNVVQPSLLRFPPTEMCVIPSCTQEASFVLPYHTAWAGANLEG